MIGRATPRRVTGIFRDFFCWTMKREKERKIKRRGGRESMGRKRRKKRRVTNAHRFVTNRFAMNRDFIGFN